MDIRKFMEKFLWTPVATFTLSTSFDVWASLKSG